MDKKNKNTKAPENTGKTIRSVPRQNTGDKKTTSIPEKPAESKPKPTASPETSKLEANKPEASNPGTIQGESSSKSNNA
ncbi:hypothetical protein H8356DRAFT_1324166 [Neocallimastix lanati (nom. inval.)]|nr:hypothetical protein H8356DRAFT_1324166 [Neocallimastix sp. JGI-2020a]